MKPDVWAPAIAVKRGKQRELNQVRRRSPCELRLYWVVLLVDGYDLSLSTARCGRMSEFEVQDDSQLVVRCRQGDGSAWRLLVQRYQRLVYAVACRAGLDEHGAADVFQTVFSRLLQALPRIAQPERLRAWIVTTAKREALLQRRRGQRTVSMTAAADDDGEASVVEIADESPLPEQLLDDLQQLHLLRLMLEQLDRRCQQLLALLFADESERLPYEGIAIQMDMPVGSVGPNRVRCLGKLRALLEKGAV